jgi:hypothetical protein
VEDLHIGFGDADFAGSDDFLQFGGEPDGEKLLALLVGIAVGKDS